MDLSDHYANHYPVFNERVHFMLAQDASFAGLLFIVLILPLLLNTRSQKTLTVMMKQATMIYFQRYSDIQLFRGFNSRGRISNPTAGLYSRLMSRIHKNMVILAAFRNNQLIQPLFGSAFTPAVRKNLIFF